MRLGGRSEGLAHADVELLRPQANQQPPRAASARGLLELGQAEQAAVERARLAPRSPAGAATCT